jgi:antitoxin CptB
LQAEFPDCAPLHPGYEWPVAAQSIDGLDPRRRRALFRAWRRGTREMDLLLGRFADAYIVTLGGRDLADLEALMEASDDEVYAWIAGQRPVPAAYATPVFRAIVAFNAGPK